MSAEKIESFSDLFRIGLEYMYDAETLLAEALPEMAHAASSAQLKQAFTEHQRETATHVQRLEQVFSKLGLAASVQSNSVVQAMIQEAKGMVHTIESPELRDAALVLAGNQIEHFEIGSYGSLRAFAAMLGKQEIISLLEQTLQEEKAADARLSQIGETEVNPKAAEVASQLA